MVKAPDFDSGMRGFESFLPCHVFIVASIERVQLKAQWVLSWAFFTLLIIGWISVSS